jgi:hypothetical protein
MRITLDTVSQRASVTISGEAADDAKTREQTMIDLYWAHEGARVQHHRELVRRFDGRQVVVEGVR